MTPLLAEILMHIHDVLRLSHDRDLHVSLLIPEALVGRRLHTLRVGPHNETSLQVLEGPKAETFDAVARAPDDCHGSIFWVGYFSLGTLFVACVRFVVPCCAFLGPLAVGIGFSSKSYAELSHEA